MLSLRNCLLPISFLAFLVCFATNVPYSRGPELEPQIWHLSKQTGSLGVREYSPGGVWDPGIWKFPLWYTSSWIYKHSWHAAQPLSSCRQRGLKEDMAEKWKCWTNEEQCRRSFIRWVPAVSSFFVGEYANRILHSRKFWWTALFWGAVGCQHAEC